MVLTVCQVGQNRNPVGVNFSSTASSATTSIRCNTPKMGSTELDNGMWSIPTEGLCQGVKKVIGASWKAGIQITYNTPILRWLDFYCRQEYHPQHPTKGRDLDFFHSFYEKVLGYWCYWYLSRCT